MGAARTAAIVLGGLAIAAASQMPAQAAVISVVSKAGLSSTPFVVSFANGAATLSFTAADAFAGPGAAVSTGGNAQVTTIFGSVADYQVGTTFDGTASYASYTSPTVVQYSAADDFIGFTYIASDGLHYGYAELFGPTLAGYAYETTAGASITANPVPEPATLALVLGGLGAIGVVRRRKPGALAA